MSSTAAVGGIAGSVGDEPWGLTLATIADRRLTGQLQLRGADAKLYRIAFVEGAVVGASSPAPADSIVRIALTNHLIPASQVATITKRIAASPMRDEHEVVADTARLSIEHAIQLRRRAMVQRAARTFSIDRGEYRLDPLITLSSIPGITVDVRAVLALGIRMNLSEHRLAADLRRLGARFRIRPAAALAIYDLGPQLAPVLDALRDGASIAEVDARHRDIELRVIQAMVYALVAGGACEVIGAARPAPPPMSRTLTPGRRPATIEDIGSRTRTTEWLERKQKTAVGAGVPARAPARGASEPAGGSKTPPVLADEAFQRGVMALRRDDMVAAVLELVRATELAPLDVDYAAMLAWAKFCAAPDKQLIAAETRRVMERAIRKSDKPMTARFYLGRVERILGRVREALFHFKQVLELEPGHADAAAEIRMLEPRAVSRR